ncbi:hypothetical protein PLESTB_000101000 [Pleodorina starrii]|uniref:Peptidase M20 dimerisation domain-containing protein n=1 Tax=Pleodorina starrii TaxID=330485 RepID=A0A9W6EXX3_9CHLO|nr:hypothetical protein PLESTM_000097500 [Pleodorina starrii]GLC48466.1 hypothetical protein PLESTB_000101000 [Pleodorina starrii]GLC71786.1 hypothetical protein PLESTF_001166800 [Pleodorina starrii]
MFKAFRYTSGVRIATRYDARVREGSIGTPSIASTAHKGPKHLARYRSALETMSGRFRQTLRHLAIWSTAMAVLACGASGAAHAHAGEALPRVLQRLESQSERYEKDLTELVRFPSVSALPVHQPDVVAAAEWLAARLQSAGLQNVEILPTEGPQPVVYGEWLGAADPAAPTVLVYGHYDVQPVDPLDEWESPPYEVVKRGGYLYGRGVDDDKGGLLQAVQAVEAWLQETGAVPVNVKFLLEGQEEVMSPHLTAFLRRHSAGLAADVALSADGGQPAADRGGISLGLRGIVSLQVDVTTAGTDMHSGMKGGSSPNPNHVLTALLAGLRHPVSHEIAVEGFYDDVVSVSELDRRDIEAYGFDPEKEAAELGLLGHVGEAGYGILEQRWHRPTLEVVGLLGGFTGEDIKTVIPRTAMAKISCRLVPRQTPQDVLAKVAAHIARHCPPYAHCNVTALGGGAFPFTNPRDSPANAAAAAVHSALSGRPPLYLRDGATIPALAAFQQVLGIDTTKFGWGLSERIHAPNERLRTDMYDKGRRAWAMLLDELPRRFTAAAAAAAADAAGGDGGKVAASGSGAGAEAGPGADVSSSSSSSSSSSPSAAAHEEL